MLKPDVWKAGKDRWRTEVKGKDCDGGVCWQYEGSYPMKKQASGVWGDGRTDGGLCGQSGVEC